jgi:hypothetical protein
LDRYNGGLRNLSNEHRQLILETRISESKHYMSKDSFQ